MIPMILLVQLMEEQREYLILKLEETLLEELKLDGGVQI